MANEIHRVLFRFHLGLPYRQASAEEKQRAADSLTEVFKKWKASGVKLLGTFGFSSHVDGFAHHLIFEIDDMSKAREMDQDIYQGEAGRFIERFEIHVGVARPFIEDIWKSS